MDFFQYYGIKASFRIDLAVLRKKFYEKSRLHHPDSKTSEAINASDAEYESAMNNLAYQTLLDPEKRLKHILETHFGKEPDASAAEDQDFLFKMMELHESVQESFGDEQLRNRCIHELEAIEQQSFELASPFLELVESSQWTPESFEALSRYYHRLKYFARLRQQLKHQEPEL